MEDLKLFDWPPELWQMIQSYVGYHNYRKYCVQMKIQNVLLFYDDTVICSLTTGTITSFDLANHIKHDWPLGHDQAIRCYTTDLKMQNLVTGSEDHTLCVWDIPNHRCRTRYVGHASTVLSVFLENTIMASGDMNGELIVWQMATGAPLYKVHTHVGEINAIVVWKEMVLSTDCWNVDIHCHGLTDGKQLPLMKGHSNHISDMMLWNSSTVITCALDHQLRKWTMDSKDTKLNCQILDGHKTAVLNMTRMTDIFLISCSEDHHICVWNVDRGTCIHTIYGAGNMYNNMSLRLVGSSDLITMSSQLIHNESFRKYMMIQNVKDQQNYQILIETDPFTDLNYAVCSTDSKSFVTVQIFRPYSHRAKTCIQWWKFGY